MHACHIKICKFNNNNVFRAIGSRWVCSMWWFFAMIVCQTYIAQLSASMTSALGDLPINNVEELGKQTKVLYGAIKGGSTIDFFKVIRFY